MEPDDTIVAISSPPGASVRGIVRLSGPEATAIADGVFVSNDGSGPVDQCRAAVLPGRLRLGTASLPASAYVFRAPRSYTRQDVVEPHLVGSPPVMAMAVEACLARGARRAEAGEFTARAFLAGALDLARRTPGGAPHRASRALREATDLSVDLLSTERVGGAVWLQVTAAPGGPCEGAPPQAGETFWLPLHGAAGRLPVWFHARGC